MIRFYGLTPASGSSLTGLFSTSLGRGDLASAGGLALAEAGRLRRTGFPLRRSCSRFEPGLAARATRVGTAGAAALGGGAGCASRAPIAAAVFG
jgi:hypothetical protein